jgi:hypothetical protein
MDSMERETIRTRSRLASFRDGYGHGEIPINGDDPKSTLTSNIR